MRESPTGRIQRDFSLVFFVEDDFSSRCCSEVGEVIDEDCSAEVNSEFGVGIIAEEGDVEDKDSQKTLNTRKMTTRIAFRLFLLTKLMC